VTKRSRDSRGYLEQRRVVTALACRAAREQAAQAMQVALEQAGGLEDVFGNLGNFAFIHFSVIGWFRRGRVWQARCKEGSARKSGVDF
jgi:hypothetical protein